MSMDSAAARPWRKGVMTDLGTLGKVQLAAAINNLGVIVGLSQSAPGDTTPSNVRGKMTDLDAGATHHPP
jgi:uncharacterized membrane protein